MANHNEPNDTEKYSFGIGDVFLYGFEDSHLNELLTMERTTPDSSITHTLKGGTGSFTIGNIPGGGYKIDIYNSDFCFDNTLVESSGVIGDGTSDWSFDYDYSFQDGKVELFMLSPTPTEMKETASRFLRHKSRDFELLQHSSNGFR